MKTKRPIRLTLHDAVMLKGIALVGLECMRDGRAWQRGRPVDTSGYSGGQVTEAAINELRRQIEAAC
jgi:hypothetical protein